MRIGEGNSDIIKHNKIHNIKTTGGEETMMQI